MCAGGHDGWGQIGVGTSGFYQEKPVKVTGIPNVIGVYLGGQHSIAVRADGTLGIWGKSFTENGPGILGKNLESADAVGAGLMMRSFVMGAALTLLIGCAPSNIARSSCESILLATGDPWSCTVKADIVGQASSIAFSTESRNQIAQVSIALRVSKGTLRLGYHDLAGGQHVLVTPSEPADLTMRTRMHREDRSFTLLFEPVNGAVEGLMGTVKYSTP